MYPRIALVSRKNCLMDDEIKQTFVSTAALASYFVPYYRNSLLVLGMFASSELKLHNNFICPHLKGDLPYEILSFPVVAQHTLRFLCSQKSLDIISIHHPPFISDRYRETEVSILFWDIYSIVALCLSLVYSL